mgnify:CR=1 FL=1
MRKSVMGEGLAEKRIFGRSLLAFTLAATLAFPAASLSFVAQAFADDPSSGDATEAPTAPVAPADEPIQRGDVHGIDFMTPTAEDGLWDLLRVDNGAGKTLYFEIEKDGVVVAPRFAYQIPNSADDEASDADYAGDVSSARIAQVVALKLAVVGQDALGQASEETDAPALSLQQVYADPNNFPTYTIKVFDAKRQGEKLYQGTVCPIYAQLVSTDGTDEWKVLGIRMVDPENDKFAETVGAGASYYKNLTGDTPIVFQSKATTEAGEPKAEVQDAAHGQRLVVTYEQVDAAAISGAVKYVDVDGNIIETEIVENLGEGKEVAIKKSFFKTTTDEAGQETTHYYRVIQRLTGSTIMLTPEQATKQIRVMEVKNTEAGAYQVTINYVDDNGNTLWTDSVDVKGKGYQYTLPNSFSMSAVTNAADAPTTDRDKGQWGVNYYTLDSWTIETNATDDNVAIGARSAETQQGNPVVAFEAGEYPAGRTVTAKYVSQATTKKVNLTVMEINGETGALIDKIHYEVTPEQAATYTPAPKDGLVPWSGNMEPVTYAWEDLEKGTDVLQYVYYVPKDYTPGDTYDITVQYMNIANSQILRSETIMVDPETNDFVNILGEEQFALGDDTYVRLAGQETAIRHAYFSPARTYTIYYRDVNDELSAQITIRRTQIVDTERVVTVPGTTVMTAAPVAAAPAVEGAAADATAPVTVDAGVGTGDAAAVINDDDNPLATLGGQDTGTERAIVDDENPLYSGLAQDVATSGSGMALVVATGAVVLVAAGLGLYWWMRRRKKNEQTATDSMNA